MKNILILSFVAMLLVFVSCNNNSNQTAPKSTDTAVNNGGPDSAANNGILPPSGAPSDANNSSLADTAYKSKDTGTKK
jgi:hypothetical protein